MSEYNNVVRSTYFWVTNPEALEQVVSDWGGKVYVYPKDRDADPDATPYMFGGYGITLPEDEEGYAPLQALLPENEVVIIMEIGHDKLKYLTAGSTVLTKHDIQYEDLTYMSVTKAQLMVNDPERYIAIAH